MTEQCKHEWRITCVWSDEYKMNVPKAYCRIGDCGEELPIKNALTRLSEYETLKAATDALSAEDVRAGLALGWATGLRDKMKAYADALAR